MKDPVHWHDNNTMFGGPISQNISIEIVCLVAWEYGSRIAHSQSGPSSTYFVNNICDVKKASELIDVYWGDYYYVFGLYP